MGWRGGRGNVPPPRDIAFEELGGGGGGGGGGGNDSEHAGHVSWEWCVTRATS